MELIIAESRRKRSWYYSDGEYICKEGSNICARVLGKYLPDPNTLREKRQIQQKRLPLNQRGLYRVEPDEVTKVLWNDWQRRQNPN